MDAREKELKKLYEDVMELYYNNEVIEAAEQLQELLTMSRELETHYYYTLGLNFMGVLQSALGNISRSVDYYFEGMLYAEKHHVHEMLPLLYNNVGSRYLDSGAYETALLYLKKSEKDAGEEVCATEHVPMEQQKRRRIVNYLNLALTSTNLKRYQESNQYLDKAERLMDGKKQTQDTEFACEFVRCQNNYFLGNRDYVQQNLERLLDEMEDLSSLYSYEQNITEMFKFLIQLKEKEKIERLLSIVEVFAKKRPEYYYRMLAIKLRTEYEKNYGTKESYQRSCVDLVEVYQEREQETLKEREQYMNLRMELKRVEAERNDAEQQHRKEEKRQKQLLTEALKEAENANIAKSEFLSKMSHEIRTPLNAVIGYINMAQNNRTHVEKLDEYHQKSQIAARHLLTIINDVLDVSAIASGHFKVEYGELDLKQIIGEINAIFRQQVLEKEIHFSVRINRFEEEILVGDSMRVKQILLNLLSNAIKFTPKQGRITLYAQQNQIANEPGQVQMTFRVQDTGIGMTKEFMDKMFTPFEQQDASISRKYGGTGLGLSISKQLAEMMGGDISVESEEGKGTTFVVNIPFEIYQQEEIEEKNEEISFPKVRALLVEGENPYAEHIGDLCSHLKIKLTTVENGAQALRQLAVRQGGTSAYGICLVEEELADMSGVELVHKLREQHGDALRIMFLTEYCTAELLEQAKREVDLIVEKPLFTSTLVDFINKKTETMQPQQETDFSQVDFSGVRVLLAEDNEMNMEIAENLLTRANLKVEKAVNGREVVDIFEASQPGTLQLILMDVQMPEMDGYEATRAIRESSHPEAKTIPIIALTANAFNEDVQQALKIGMNGHIAKPIHIQELYEILRNTLAIEEGNRDNSDKW